MMRKQQQQIEEFVTRIKDKNLQLKSGRLDSTRNLGALTKQLTTENKRSKYKKQYTSNDLVQASNSRKQ